MPLPTQAQQTFGTGGVGGGGGGAGLGYGRPPAGTWPGSGLGDLSRVAFRGSDPAAMLRGELPMTGPAGAVAPDTRNETRPEPYPGAGAPGANPPRPSAPPTFAGALDSRSRGSMFTTGPAAPPPQGPGAFRAGRGARLRGAGLIAPLPAFTPYSAQLPPPPPTQHSAMGGGALVSPPPLAPPSGVMASAASAAPPAAAPAETVTTETKAATATGAGPAKMPEARPWEADERSFKDKFGRSKPAAWSSWTGKQQNEWKASHYTPAGQPPVVTPPGGTSPPPGQGELPPGTTSPPPDDSREPPPPPPPPPPGGFGGQVVTPPPVPPSETPTTYGDVYNWQTGEKPPKASDYWESGKGPDFPDFTYDSKTSSGAFTIDGKPLVITSSYVPAEDMLRIPSGRPGYRAVTQLLNRAQGAAATLIEAENETDLDRRGDMIAKASSDLQKHVAGLERYGIFYRPFSGSENPLRANEDPYSDLPTNFPSGLVINRGLKGAFADMNKSGVPPEAMGSLLELMQRRTESEMSLANKNRAFQIGQENLGELESDPARARFAGIAGEIADNPDPLGAEGNEYLRGATAEQYDRSLEDANAGLARTAAGRGLDPLTFAGTSYAGGMENRRALSNRLGELDIERSLRRRTGQQDALNALRGVLQNTGAVQSQRSDLMRLLMDQGLLGQNASAGLSEYSTGFRASQEALKAQQDAKDLADAEKKAGIYKGAGALGGAVLAAALV